MTSLSFKQKARKAERKRAEQRYGHLYGHAHGVGHDKCVYCGWPKESIDHVPPLSWVYALGSGHFARAGVSFLVYPACRECNSLLGDRRLLTLEERAGFLSQSIAKKYKRYRKSTLWESEEIAELRGNLKRVVENFRVMQVATDRRLENLLSLRNDLEPQEEQQL